MISYDFEAVTVQEYFTEYGPELPFPLVPKNTKLFTPFPEKENIFLKAKRFPLKRDSCF